MNNQPYQPPNNNPSRFSATSDYHREEKEFEEKVVEIKRVSKKTKGGNQIGFTALVVIGNKNGQIGKGHAYAKDVSSAIQKAIRRAKRSLITIPLKDGTISRPLSLKFKAAQIIIRPGRLGGGLVAGGPVRIIAELAGIKHLVAKIKGSRNKHANVTCVFKAFSKL